MSSIENEPQPQFLITEMTVGDIEPATRMRLQSWADTYINNSAGVTSEWIEQHNQVQLSPEKQKSRQERFLVGKQKNTFNAWVAKDSKGNIIGSTTPFIDEDGTQRVGSMYVDKEWLGKGVGNQLMQKVIGWFDSAKPIELTVVSYNERAKAFYKKWGFEEIPGSIVLHDGGVIPEIRMIRRPGDEI